VNNAAQLLIATTNPDKAGEVSRILAATLEEELHRVTILNLTNLPWQDPPEEDGGSYEANARIKARAAVRRLPTAACLADDSGIEVAAFGGRPGIHSARWGAEEKGQRLSALELNRLLLEQMRQVPAGARMAQMVTVVVLRLPSGIEYIGHGSVSGSIAMDIAGSEGFGFDSIFLLPDGRRLSQVSASVKDSVSHRGAAVRMVAPYVAAWVRSVGRP
jgi:XTP/dITP diphosphohydrolase